MVTYFLGREEVDAYARDLVRRLKQSNPVPELWCAITNSGVDFLSIMLRIVAQTAPELLTKVSAVSLFPPSGSDQDYRLADETDFKGRSVLLFDSTIHGGGTMLGAQAYLKQQGAARICTYSLVLKRGSAFIPTLWGVMINDEDRAYFLLDEIPNNRLMSHRNQTYPYASIRKLTRMDVDLKHIVKTDSSLDRTEWEDRWFDMQTSELAPCTYVLENDSCIVGYLTVHTSRESHLQVTEVGVCKSQQGKGYGDTLIRFADTLARQSKCRAIRLQAIENKIGFYEKFGYTATAGATITTFGTESYLAMEKTLLYHTPYGNHSL